MAPSAKHTRRCGLLQPEEARPQDIDVAVVAILTPIYEAEFLGFSYGK
jgi:hypothetical protein